MDKILVTRSSIPTVNEYMKEIQSVFDSHWLTNMGVKHQELQRRLQEYLGVSHVELFTNGHMALELTLQAMHFEDDAEIITTPFTFASTTHAIVRNRLKPVFCDIRKDNYTIDETKIEPLITPKTRAIFPVHVYGNICNVEAIEKIAKKYGLKVIYDAAHAFGIVYKGKNVASFGDVSCFSFHATKVFNTIEGGAAIYKDESLGRKLYFLKNFGIANEENIPEIGANAKMNEFCVAMGLCNLRHIQEEIEKRKLVYERYISRLNGIRGIVLPQIQNDVVPNYAYFPVLFQPEILGFGRDDVFEKLRENNIYARKYFYPLTSEYACYSSLLKVEKTPVAYKISRQILTLPIYAELELEQVDKICDIILKNMECNRGN